MLLERSKSTSINQESEDYLTNSNVVYLEFLRPSIAINDYDENYHQFKLYFTRFTPKLYIGSDNDSSICPIEYLFDCDDSYCVHPDVRCNGINDCRSKADEELCTEGISNEASIYYVSYFTISIRYICMFILIFML